jgi:tRNA wybutosine-synthesizing protein 2
MQLTPFENIKRKVSQELSSDVVGALPDKWEKIGSVVIIKISDGLHKYQQVIGKIYAEELECSTVLNDRGGISGVFREPNVEVIFGSQSTETIHKENGIRYRLDPQRIMFSSGNLKERQRMARVSNAEETIVDLFAGIGYFTIPMAVYSMPRRIVACEMNPLAYRYLCENVVLNHVSRIVEPVLGDNRQTAPRDCADRVILGYLKESYHFLPIALGCLRNNRGILHYHEVVPSRFVPEQPLRRIQEAGKRLERSVELLKTHVIKSYAPGIYHVVLDVRIFE